MKKLILASSSIDRKNLLQKLKLEFISVAPDINEQPKRNEHPRELVLRLAKEKAHALKSDYPNHLIISSDQVASFDNHIPGKPGSYSNTVKQLKRQSGKAVNFYTSICVLDTDSGVYYIDIDLCTAYFKELSEQQITHYVKSDTPFNCAGGFKSEGLGISLFNKITGEDPNALIGLPLIKLIKILEKFDVYVI